MKVIDFPNANCIEQIYNRSEIADHAALAYKGETFTFGELRKAVFLCAKDLKSRGIKPDDIVALWGYGCIEWIVSFFAIVRLGAVPVLLSHGIPLRKILVDLALVKPDFLVVGNTSALKADQSALDILLEETGLSSAYYCFNEMELKSRISNNEDLSENEYPDLSKPNRLAMFMTSGTTGKPKIVEISQDGFMDVARSCSIAVGKFSEGTIVVGLPLFHVYGLDSIMAYLGMGRLVVIPDNLKPRSIIAAIIDYKALTLSTVGALMALMVVQPDFRIAYQYLRLAVMGGGLTPPRTTNAIKQYFPNITLINGYGLTETCGAITIALPSDS